MFPTAGAPPVTAKPPTAIELYRLRVRQILDPGNAEFCPDVDIAAEAPGDAAVQAISGLMEVHGRDAGRPRRLGLDVPSVGAAILASQGAIAGALARLRGIRVDRVYTSLMAGALAFLHHHLALETCGNDLPFRQPPPTAGPPFRTRDGHLIEIEALLGANWTHFWVRLGIAEDLAADAWLPFVFRFLSGRCSLPLPLHLAIGRHTWAEVREIAQATDLSMCRVRSYSELMQESWRPSDHVYMRETTTAGTAQDDRFADRTSGPLSGMRVVEVTSRLQGPLAALLLQHLGAGIVKVEPPGGDFGRKAVPRAGGVGAAYLAYNRGKERMELDYKQSGDRERLVQLIADADVFLQNWPPGRAEVLGLDPVSVTRLNPRIVYAHASGWGRGSPPCSVASDYVVQAHAASGDGLYPVGEIARPSRLTVVDAVGGLVACEGILSGLYQREKSGRGQQVETSLFGGALSLQAHLLADIERGAEIGRKQGRAEWDVFDEPVAAFDGYLFVGPLSVAMRRRLADLCSVRDLSERHAIASRLRSKPAAEWLETLNQSGIPAELVCTDLRTLTADPRAACWIEHVDRSCWVPASPWRFTA